ncbi:Nitrogen fixation protein NifS [Mycoplasmopsis bovigenitalium 51080]|uniref:Nitrogen fixation protein NifS n=1 Tax=Mycoplasmopsis bovigenitalium 51080 TaxID=1188235 RepID=N9TU20_9BACT|nr:aminotransferase class V-fold PLP-dependent enzyme [Mycoplasmopsis bovigenitalium]ENY69590.1 Nitrogen fixation protein NifS [Mycoplasmopsis bovigenitalium 51080]
MKHLRNQFPMAKKIVYLDSAALVLKPNDAIKAVNNFYKNYSVSVRTSNSPLGIKNDLLIKNLRQKVAKLLLTNLEETSIIFTSGTTASLNNFAQMYSNSIEKGDEILLSAHNHSSNFIPWIEVAKLKNATIKVSQNMIEDINKNTKIIALSQITNNFHIDFDLNEIYAKAQKYNAIVVNDAAQAIVNEQVSMQNADVVAFSTNKFYGPTGVGVLAVKNNLLKKLSPNIYGGGSVLGIAKDCNWIQNNSIEGFEPGTANFAGLHMFDAALTFFNQNIGYEKTNKIIRDLSNYTHKILKKVKNIEIYSKPGDHIVLFNIKQHDSHDVAHYLGTQNIYVRSGVFCAHYLKNIYNENSYVRVSLGIYNNKKDIKRLVEALNNGGDFIVI